MKTRSVSQSSLDLINTLRHASTQEQVRLWKDIAERISRSRKNRAEVNVKKLEVYGKGAEYLVVPGKVLGVGEIKSPVKVAALSFSESARTKIAAAGGKAYSIADLIRENPKGKGVHIIR